MDHSKPELASPTNREQILAYDEWFRYAEQIAQSRLYNFLMAASIMLLGCATLLGSSANFPSALFCQFLSVLLALLGAKLSRIFYFQGLRQQKFHNMLDDNLRILFERCEGNEFADYPIRKVYDMKKNPKKFDKKFQLNSDENDVSSRLVLSTIPRMLEVAFFVTAAIAFFAVYVDLWEYSKFWAIAFLIVGVFVFVRRRDVKSHVL